MSKNTLFTAGYSGFDSTSFLENLRKHKIEVLIDVRDSPRSRKKGFSGTQLEAFLQSNGIGYLHTRDLGVPAELRKKLQAGEIELNEYFNKFRRHLEKHTDAVAEVYRLATHKTCCLMCVEACAHECHRSVVAEAVLAQNGRKLEVTNL